VGYVDIMCFNHASAALPAETPTGTHLTARWMDPNVGLRRFEEQKNYLPLPGTKHDFSVIQPVA
jgi:hypothetical protein